MSLFVHIVLAGDVLGCLRRPAAISLASAVGTTTCRWNAPRERPVPAPAVRISPSLRLCDENAADVRGVDGVVREDRQRQALAIAQTRRLDTEFGDLRRIDPPM